MATLIFLAGIAFGTSINDSPIRNLQVARVGLYVQQDVFQEQGGRLTFARPASARPKGSFWFGNSDPKRIIVNDGSVLLEMPFLSAVGFSFLLLLGLAAGGYFIEYQSTRLPE